MNNKMSNLKIFMQFRIFEQKLTTHNSQIYLNFLVENILKFVLFSLENVL